jgi:hypothetical protein
MSVFSKSPGSKPEQPAAKPAAPTKPAVPAVTVSRTIDIGGTKIVAPPMPAPPARTATTTQKIEPKPKSVRPSAPPMLTPGEQLDGSASIQDTFEKLLTADVDARFQFIEREPGTSPTIEGIAPTDLDEVRALFAQLAANHVRQVRDFMIDVRWSEATVEWIAICIPAIRSLRRAADKLTIEELVVGLDAFSEALTSTQMNGGGRTIEGERRDAILAAYEKLTTVMPQAFALDMDRTQREAVILQSLLLQVPEVKKVTIDKLYAAGLTTLEAMLLANPGDIAATTGIDEALAKRIVTRFREYRDQVRNGVPDATRAQERERIATLTARLRQEHEAFERASRGWTSEAEEQKRQSRTARARTLLDIQVVLARLGEVDRLKEIERLPFDRKLAHLESFLEEARDKYVAQP